MFEVARQMSTVSGYLETENSSDKPLFQWNKYAAYRKLHLATVQLEKAAGHLKSAGDKIRQV